MDRLQSEWQRLFLPAHTADGGGGADTSSLVDANGLVRAMVLELARPAEWDVLSRVWTGVQADLGFPAPAVAVSGVDGLQLWFSLEEGAPAVQAQAFLGSLRARYLADIAGHRVSLMPALDLTGLGVFRHAPRVPDMQAQTGYWSAFVSSELAQVFAETPWMDIRPSSDAQAGVLSRMRSIAPPAFAAALQQIRPAAPAPGLPSADTIRADVGSWALPLDAQAAGLSPKQFLLQVMHDPGAALVLRVEAAKALLPYWGERQA